MPNGKKKHEQAKSQPVTSEQSTPEQSTPEPVKAEPTVQELMAQLQSALDKGDYKLVAQVSRQIDQRERAKEKLEVEAKRAKQDEIASYVKSEYATFRDKMIAKLEDMAYLDLMDGIWISDDFGEQAPTVRTAKSAAKAPRTGGGGTGKKFDISTDDMLVKHGKEVYKDGLTFKAAYDQNTDKNWRYAIRQKLLKLEGII